MSEPTLASCGFFREDGLSGDRKRRWVWTRTLGGGGAKVIRERDGRRVAPVRACGGRWRASPQKGRGRAAAHVGSCCQPTWAMRAPQRLLAATERERKAEGAGREGGGGRAGAAQLGVRQGGGDVVNADGSERLLHADRWRLVRYIENPSTGGGRHAVNGAVPEL